jgi:hypothetical protein
MPLYPLSRRCRQRCIFTIPLTGSHRPNVNVDLLAATPQNGQSLVDMAGPMMTAARDDGRVVDRMELVLYPGMDPMHFYGVKDPEQIAWMEPRLTPHPWKCFEQKLWLTNEAAMRKIPQSHIVCTSTLQFRDVAALKALSDGRVWDIDTGHELMITEPAGGVAQICGEESTLPSSVATKAAIASGSGSCSSRGSGFEEPRRLARRLPHVGSISFF